MESHQNTGNSASANFRIGSRRGARVRRIALMLGAAMLIGAWTINSATEDPPALTVAQTHDFIPPAFSLSQIFSAR